MEPALAGPRPSLTDLTTVLRGSRAPTWLVVRGPGTADYLLARTGSVIERRYHPVARVCGRQVYLRDGVHRPAPLPPPSCHSPLAGSLGQDRWHRDV